MLHISVDSVEHCWRHGIGVGIRRCIFTNEKRCIRGVEEGGVTARKVKKQRTKRCVMANVMVDGCPRELTTTTLVTFTLVSFVFVPSLLYS